VKHKQGLKSLRCAVWVGAVKGDLTTSVLKGVSRSFYLTLRLLPAAMRPAASVGYLLARTSDTIADTTRVPVDDRLALLDRYAEAVKDAKEAPSWSPELLEKANPREKVLLQRGAEILSALETLPTAEQALVREVLGTIISGQRLDLEHFRKTTPAEPITFASDAELEDYAWRVAGSVGAFWTKLGFLTLGDSFSTASQEELLERGIRYGKGLQLVNILRDLPRDVAAGRCYLPVPNAWDRNILLESHARWLKQAKSWVADGEWYAQTLLSRRLRAATMLPAWLAQETLEKLEKASWADLETRVKIPRKRVYSLLWKAWWK
jgi:farnesyl-diphosphate farnesyltransferase